MDPEVSRGYEGFRGTVRELASQSIPWDPPAARHAGGDSPNIVIILVDDLGFSDLGPFGSEIDTPNIDALADGGWVFSNYRTAPVCSPARASLLTGLNPHRVGFGTVAHVNPGYPGFSCEIPDNVVTLPEALRQSGYATFMVGKWHLTPESKLHDGAEKSSWPLQRGFDRYYGCMDGFTSLYHPHRLVRDNSVLDLQEYPANYFLTDDLTDEALGMIADLRMNDTKRPFFLYFAHVAVHGPLQAKPESIERYRGRYAEGWNRLREARMARQFGLGITQTGTIPETTSHADPSAEPRWEDLSEGERELFARHMEVYAAAVSDVDASVGRVVEALEKSGDLNNTIIVVASDNGGTAEGGTTGTRSYFSQFVSGIELPKDWIADVPRDSSLLGGPRVHGHYPAGWARVSNSPFKSFKGSVYEGGVHAPLIISWPGAPEPQLSRGLRDQFVFVSDLTPTLLELAGVELPEHDVHAPWQKPDGVSIADVLADPAAPGRTRQYFESFGARALIDHNWKAVAPVPPGRGESAITGPWELYNLRDDPGEQRDLSGKFPEEADRLSREWRDEAWMNTVFPLNDDGSMFRSRSEAEEQLSESIELAPFRPPLERFRSSKLTVLRSFCIDVRLSIEEGASGVIVSHGDQGGGYLFALDRGEWLFAYNAYGDMHRHRTAVTHHGTVRLLLRFAEVEGLKWSVSIELDGALHERMCEVPMHLGMAPFTGISVGYDFGGPVDWDLHMEHGKYSFRGGEILRLRYLPGARSRHDQTMIRKITEATARLAD